MLWAPSMSRNDNYNRIINNHGENVFAASGNTLRTWRRCDVAAESVQNPLPGVNESWWVRKIHRESLQRWTRKVPSLKSIETKIETLSTLVFI